jgi:hypothetical protein
MKANLKLLKVSLSNVLGFSKDLTLEQLNEIPEGFSNNVIWNLAHLVVTQRLLIYGLGGLELGLELEFIDKYKKGSKPEGKVSKEEVDEILSLLSKEFEKFTKDIETGIFKTYKNYPTSYNFEITNFEDAITFNNLHFGLHVSTILKLRKLVS